MSTVLLTLPQQDWAPGTYGPFVTTALASGSLGYVVNYTTSGTNFPTDSAGEVLQYLVERSEDGGATWNHDADIVIAAVPWKDRAGNPTTSGIARRGWALPCGSTTMLRGSLIVLRACNIGGTLVSMP